MDPEVVFAAIYATAVVLVAVALDHVGRATARRPGALAGEARPDGPAWPLLASVTLHTAIATVASVAGLLVAAVVGVRHHEPVELAVLAVPALLAALTIRRSCRRLRNAAASEAVHV